MSQVATLLAVAFALSACAVHAAEPATITAAPATITIDARAREQRIDGFGFSVRIWSDPHLSNNPTTWVPQWAQDEIVRRLFTELGATRAHMVIDGGIEVVNDNQDPMVFNAAGFNFQGKRSDELVAFVKQAQPAGLRVFYPVPLVLEKWMKPSDADEYVEWALAILLHWQALGAEPPYYAIFNEPRMMFGIDWWLRVVRGLGARMRKLGIATMLVVPEDLNACSAVPTVTAILNDPEARRYIGAISYHEYEYGSGAQAAGCRAQIRALAAKHQLPVWMSEHSLGSDYPNALAWAREMHRLLAEDGVNGVDYMWGFFGAWEARATLLALDFTGTGFIRYSRLAPYFVMGQYTRYARPGDYRVKTASSDPALLVTAFAGRDGLAIVIINDGDAPRDAQLQVSGMNVATLSGERTSQSESWIKAEAAPLPLRTNEFALRLPAKSVTSVRGAPAP